MNEKELREFLANQDKELKEILTKGESQLQVHSARLLALEQHVTAPGFGGSSSFGGFTESLGELVTKHEGFLALQKGDRSRTGQIAVRSFHPAAEKTVLSGTWSSGPQFLPVVATPGQRRLMVRDLLPQSTTISNLIEYAREDTITSGAGYQIPEGSAKPETSATYSLQTQAVVQLAHWLGASRQLLDDSAAFSQYVNGRMMYLLQVKEETELLFGDNSTGHLRGLCPSATPFAGSGTGLIDATPQSISTAMGSPGV